MGFGLLQKLESKKMTREQLYKKVEQDYSILPEVIKGLSSSKAAVRYGCGRVLVDFSGEHPEKLYTYMDFFINLLNSKYRILTWNAMYVIANLTKVDRDKKFDQIFDKYYSFLNNEYMVTVANIVSCSSKIALAKPYLIQKITDKLLEVENISTSPHMTEECKRVVVEKTVEFFDLFFDQIKDRNKVISFTKRHLDSPRRTLRKKVENFIRRRGSVEGFSKLSNK